MTKSIKFITYTSIIKYIRKTKKNTKLENLIKVTKAGIKFDCKNPDNTSDTRTML